MTPIQREELDKEIEWAKRDFKRLNVVQETDGTTVIKWICFGLAVMIAVLVGAEVIFHAWAWFHG